MIEAQHLTKLYGPTRAVDDLSFKVVPGRVTGFLGPNGAGKSTTMRVIMGLDAATTGQVTINGTPYIRHTHPMREVGALLDARAFHTGRTAFNHLLCLAQSNRIPHARVDEVLALVGLESVAKRRAGGFSMGMGQRLGIAAALLGDPGVLLFDEPVNGLDPEGILWVRNLLKSLAAEGRTVFVSSHLMSEMALTADHLIVIGKGRLIADATVTDFVSQSTGAHVRVRALQPDDLARVLVAEGAKVERVDDGALRVTGLDCRHVGALAARHGLELHELVLHQPTLEAAYMEATQDATEYRAAAPAS
ncbi:MAG TPA: ATP-binding cassette domain-containing protein [Acidimicrobiales bacterium]|nr:ATP-binding cassette domain-containing protein [Acidimicrobiales bacterium]